jgi:rfaE bifunctional protein kinase chain/domain
VKGSVLLDILAKLPGKSILIVGDVMLDEYIWGEVRRVSPEAPVPVVELQRRTYALGGAANVAANVTSLEGRAILAGIVGDDAQSRILREELFRCGIEGDGLLIDCARPTTTKSRIIAHNQQVVRLDSEQCNSLSPQMEEALLDWIEKHLEEADILVLSDYAKGVITSRLAEEVICIARGASKPIVVDPKGRAYCKYRGATVVTPNTQEAHLALNHLLNLPDDLTAMGQQLLMLLGGSAVLITRGPEGMTLFDPGRQAVHIPAAGRHVYDVTGAGDTVVATLALALAAGATLEQGARLANAAAGIVVGKVGTATVESRELMASVAELPIAYEELVA